MPPLLLIKTVFTGAWFAVFATGERLAPASRRPPETNRARLARNLGLWLMNTALSPVLIIPISAWAASVQLWQRPAAISGSSGLALDIVLLDLWIYVWHRANHECSLLWRFHQIHHRDEFLDATSAVRFHAGEVLASALARAPLIIAAAIPLSSVLVFETCALAAAIFHHSNLRLPERAEAMLRWLIVTPSHHWVHHHARRADTDSNYATLLTLWDWLFRTWSTTPRTPCMQIGAEGAPDLPLVQLIVAPFGAPR